MPVKDLIFPSRLLAGGGPGSPDPRVLRALTTPLIGQFDPDFTAVMDEVMQLARDTFLTRNARCFPVSGLAAAGLEALLNTLVEPGVRVAIGGGSGFVAETAEVARRYGAQVTPIDDLASGAIPKLVVVPFVDSTSGRQLDVRNLGVACHAAGAIRQPEARMEPVRAVSHAAIVRDDRYRLLQANQRQLRASGG